MGHANLDVDFQVRMERGSDKPKNRDRKSVKPRLSAPSPPAPPPTPSTEILSISTDGASELKKHAQEWYERQAKIAGKRIEALESNLGLDGKTKTRGAKSKTRGATKKSGDPDQVVRDERQLECWKGVRNVLNELEPDESLRDALEMLYLGPLVNQVRQLDTFNGTQTRLALLRERCQRKRRELKRVEIEIEEIEKTLEQKDEEMRNRFWRCLKYYRGHLRDFDDDN